MAGAKGWVVMKTHYLKHPIRRPKSGWQRLLDTLRALSDYARSTSV